MQILIASGTLIPFTYIFMCALGGALRWVIQTINALLHVVFGYGWLQFVQASAKAWLNTYSGGTCS